MEGNKQNIGSLQKYFLGSFLRSWFGKKQWSIWIGESVPHSAELNETGQDDQHRHAVQKFVHIASSLMDPEVKET